MPNLHGLDPAPFGRAVSIDNTPAVDVAVADGAVGGGL